MLMEWRIDISFSITVPDNKTRTTCGWDVSATSSLFSRRMPCCAEDMLILLKKIQRAISTIYIYIYLPWPTAAAHGLKLPEWNIYVIKLYLVCVRCTLDTGQWTVNDCQLICLKTSTLVLVTDTLSRRSHCRRGWFITCFTTTTTYLLLLT